MMKIQINNNCSNRIISIVNGNKHEFASKEQAVIDLQYSQAKITLVCVDEKTRIKRKKNVVVLSEYEVVCKEGDVLEIYIERYEHNKLEYSNLVYSRAALECEDSECNLVRCEAVNRKKLKVLSRHDYIFNIIDELCFDFLLEGVPVAAFVSFIYFLLCRIDVFIFRWWIIGCIFLVAFVIHFATMFFVNFVVDSIFKPFGLVSSKTDTRRFSSSEYLFDYFQNKERLSEIIEVDRVI